ncbi:MAG TPA: sugar phosphate nucleotidyltransferase [Anaeromyxobacter sp.]|nr:sugar phosphate nucleotidyltransferase [Anaeromyxobacter sp.]
MDTKRAIITAAGESQRTLPLQTLVDQDGETKSALRILVEEALSARIEEICVVVAAGDEAAYATAAGPHRGRLRFVVQERPAGYGHAVHCARDFARGEPFLLMVGDHLYVSRAEKRCAQQLVEVARAERCAVSTVQPTHESKLPYYGTVGGHRVANRQGLYEITQVIEKPTPTEAEQKLLVPGLRAGHYLCFFGMHVLSPLLMELLGQALREADGQRSVPLTPSLATLASRERYLAHEVLGSRYDIGLTYGLLSAQLALALSGHDRDQVLSLLVELLATRTPC